MSEPDLPPVIIDTREQTPWTFEDYDVEIVYEPLKTGDYTLAGYQNQFAIERKNINDFCLSLGKNRERFQREMERASGFHEFQIIIEGKRWWFYDYQGEASSPHVRSQISPNSVIGTIEAWENRYGVEFRWAGNKTQAEWECLEKLKEWYDSYT